MNKQKHFDSTIKILTDIVSDWDSGYDGGISDTTTLVQDLGFESIDIVYMLTAIEQYYGRRDFPFEDLLMVDGRHVDDLAVSRIVEFLDRHIQTGEISDTSGLNESGIGISGGV